MAGSLAPIRRPGGPARAPAARRLLLLVAAVVVAPSSAQLPVRELVDCACRVGRGSYVCADRFFSLHQCSRRCLGACRRVGARFRGCVAARQVKWYGWIGLGYQNCGRGHSQHFDPEANTSTLTTTTPRHWMRSAVHFPATPAAEGDATSAPTAPPTSTPTAPPTSSAATGDYLDAVGEAWPIEQAAQAAASRPSLRGAALPSGPPLGHGALAGAPAPVAEESADSPGAGLPEDQQASQESLDASRGGDVRCLCEGHDKLVVSAGRYTELLECGASCAGQCTGLGAASLACVADDTD